MMVSFESNLKSGSLAALAVLVLLLAASPASAATLNVVWGQLVGASDVEVDGAFYDVEFIDGKCVDLFTPCTSSADFVFQNLPDVLLAAQAISDQVLIGVYDTNPTLTLGCTSPAVCNILTPYLVQWGTSVRVGQTPNGTGVVDNAAHDSNTSTTYDTGGATSLVWAVWTPVPEPGTSLLLGIGLVAWVVHRRG